jgi:hypothetical protein
LLTPVPSAVLRRLQLIVRPDTVLRWHRDLLQRRHAAISKRKRPGRPRTVASIRRLALRLVHGNPGRGYRRVHGELAMLGIKVTASTVWQILRDADIDPAPERAATAWGARLPQRVVEPHVDLEPDPPAARAARIRNPLQRASA